MNIIEAIEELKKFSNEILTLNDPIESNEITNLEIQLAVPLPPDYKKLLEMHNGINLFGTEVFGISTDSDPFALKEVYLFEHYEVANEMPLYLVPFSPDGGGNHYCFDTRHINENSCPIVFWQHDYLYSDNDEPEVTHQGLGGWIKEVMIDCVLEDYNYDGTEKE